MGDAKDILGIPRGPGAGALAGKPKKRANAGAEKPPKGISREVWQITRGTSVHDGDARAPVMPTAVALHGLKDKRKITARTVT